ncbi:electron transfer complex ferredoxin TmcB [Desulfonatronovibrio hydrogenovorans]|uniref:electron transfer complex ferredoxin TmcB n=1 Tax=Desulfonatronovibrio hydrogenovorans TaxID=53245 RepID=UPI00048AECB0|nr:(Fe-S)-binding protein [Desulfonatronovibrio hydrogenovorans]
MNYRTTEDIGLITGAKNLTAEKIRSAVHKVFSKEAGPRLKAYYNTCVRCGLCSQACHYFLSMDNDPSFSPVGKVKQTVWELLDPGKRITPDFIVNAAQIAYTECNLCRRCSMYCPFGIDTAYMITLVRRLCHLLGVTPQYIQDTAHSHASTMNQMWIKEDEWIDSLQWQEDEARDELPMLRIPIEKNGAEIFYSVIGPEPKFRSQLIYQAAVIMNVAQVDWTMPATPGWDNSDMAMYVGDYELMGRMKKIHFETALRLKCKKIVMGECGHAFRSVYDTGSRWLGWKEPPVPIIHAVQFYWDLLNEGKIRVGKKFEQPVTFHDPCNIVRGMGLHEKARDLVRAFCRDFVEMHPNREHNYCCCAGGGVINCGPPHKKTRVLGNKIKADQLRATGVPVVIAPCHNCHGGLEDILHHYKVDMQIKFLGDIIYECIDKTSVE